MSGRKKVWPPPLKEHKGYARAKDPATGQYKSFGKAGPEARKRYAAWLAGLSEPAPIEITLADLTVADVLDRWFAERDSELHPKERKNYIYSIRDLKETHGNTAARLFDVPALKSHRKTISKKLAPRTTNSRIGRIRTIWRWAEEEKIVPPGSWQHLLSLKALKCPPKPNRSCTLEDIEQVCAFLRPEAADMLRLQYWTGMRPGEVRIMAWSMIEGNIYYPEQHKGKHRGHVRAVVLSSEAMEILAKYRQDKTCPNSGQNVSRPIFLNRLGKPYSDEAYSRHIMRKAKIAGVHVTAYSARHGFKDRLLREGKSLDEVRAAMGQVSLGMTNDYGSAADLELARRAVEKPDKAA